MLNQMQGQPVPEDDVQSVPGVEPATPEEEAELQRAQGALAKVLYENDASFQSVVKKLSASEVPPINRLADTTVMLVAEIDNKINLDEVVIMEFAATVYDAVYEIAVTAQAFELDDATIKQGLMVTLQVIMESYGVSEEDFNQFAESIGEQGASQLINTYKQETEQWARS